MVKMARILFFVALAALLWAPTGVPVVVIVTNDHNLGGPAHLGLLAGTYAISFAIVVGIARLVRRRRRVS